MSTNVEVLRSVPLFQGMSDRSIETIAGLAFETDFPRARRSSAKASRVTGS